jgi:hypothetical protein
MWCICYSKLLCNRAGINNGTILMSKKVSFLGNTLLVAADLTKIHALVGWRGTYAHT